MPIKIHHGPPGSYKTAGALGDDFLREARAGRVIVTNVRGITRERVLEQFPDLPDSFDIIHLGDKSEEDRQKWARWFHWVPNGAFLFVDEIQMIWPKNWREADIRKFDYPGGVDQAAIDNRPATWEEAFEKHRHWNWDMVFTTPNYKKVRDDVKQCAEMAYKHKNLAVIGFSGRYIEAAHLADDEGTYAGHFLSINRKKVPPYVFKLYDSTATGKVKDTNTGISLFKNPKVAGLLLVLVFAIGLAAYNLRNGFMGNTRESAKAADSPPVAVDPKASDKNSGVPSGGLPAREGSPVVPVVGLFANTVYIVGSVAVGGHWRYIFDFGSVMLNSSQLIQSGFVVVPRGQCSALVKYEDQSVIAFCGRPQESRGVL